MSSKTAPRSPTADILQLDSPISVSSSQTTSAQHTARTNNAPHVTVDIVSQPTSPPRTHAYSAASTTELHPQSITKSDAESSNDALFPEEDEAEHAHPPEIIHLAEDDEVEEDSPIDLDKDIPDDLYDDGLSKPHLVDGDAEDELTAGGTVAVDDANQSQGPKMWMVYVALVLSQLLWSGNHVVNKSTFGLLPVFVVPLIRAILTSPLLFLTAYHIAPYSLELSRKDTWSMILLAFLGSGINSHLFNVGLMLSSAGDAGMMQPAVPVMTALVAVALGREKASILKFMGIGCSVLGCVIMVLAETFGAAASGGEGAKSTRGWGLLCFILQSACFSAFLTLQKPLLERIPPLTITFYTFAFGGFFHFWFACYYFTRIEWLALPPTILLNFMYISIFASFIANSFFAMANKYLPGSIAAMAIVLQPVFSPTLGFIFLGEMVTSVHVIGAFCIIGGVVVVVVARQQELKKVIKENIKSEMIRSKPGLLEIDDAHVEAEYQQQMAAPPLSGRHAQQVIGGPSGASRRMSMAARRFSVVPGSLAHDDYTFAHIDVGAEQSGSMGMRLQMDAEEMLAIRRERVERRMDALRRGSTYQLQGMGHLFATNPNSPSAQQLRRMSMISRQQSTRSILPSAQESRRMSIAASQQQSRRMSTVGASQQQSRRMSLLPNRASNSPSMTASQQQSNNSVNGMPKLMPVTNSPVMPSILRKISTIAQGSFQNLGSYAPLQTSSGSSSGGVTANNSQSGSAAPSLSSTQQSNGGAASQPPPPLLPGASAIKLATSPHRVRRASQVTFADVVDIAPTTATSTITNLKGKSPKAAPNGAAAPQKAPAAAPIHARPARPATPPPPPEIEPGLTAQTVRFVTKAEAQRQQSSNSDLP